MCASLYTDRAWHPVMLAATVLLRIVEAEHVCAHVHNTHEQVCLAEPLWACVACVIP